jgi:hypothetical protein
VWAAIWIWRQFPRQIAADLRRHYQLHIKHWHRGDRGADGDLILSSYDLLELIEGLPPDDSAFKAAAERGGRWPVWQQMLAEVANEGYRLRAAYHAVNGGAEAAFNPAEFAFIDPVQREWLKRAEQAAEQQQQQSITALESEWGFS